MEVESLARVGLRMGLLALVCAVGPLAGAGDQGAGEIDSTRAALEKWVETQRVISQERRDLALAKEILAERTSLVQREIEELRGKIRDAEGSIAEADRKRAELAGENDALAQASAALGEALAALEQGTRQLLVRLPEPVQERVEPLSQRLPDDPAETKRSLSERFQNVVGILNEVNKASREIAVTSEVRSLPDGSSAEVTVLYLGIGQAFYCGAGDTIAGIGRPGEEGWGWTPADEWAPQIARAIAILKNEQVASFVQLPVEIR